MKKILAPTALFMCFLSASAFSHTCTSKIGGIFPYKGSTYITPKSQCVISGKTISSFILPNSDPVSNHMISVALTAYTTQDDVIFHFSQETGVNRIMDGLQIVK